MPRSRSFGFALLALLGPVAVGPACGNADGPAGEVTDDDEPNDDGQGGEGGEGGERPAGGAGGRAGGAAGRGGSGGGAAGAAGGGGDGTAAAAGGAAGAPQGGAGAGGEAGVGGQAPTMRPPWKGEGPPKELGEVVPVFVAAGFGARTVISCDDGRTWKAQHQLGNDNADHSPYTHKGLAYGNGTFVQLIGWGAEGSVKVSTDGVTWERRTVSAGGMGGIGFADGAFVLVESFGSRVSTDGGKTWTAGGATGHGYHVRGGGGGGPGVIAGGGSGQTAVTSWDKGKTWVKASDCPPMKHHNLGQYGGAAWGAGGLVLVSDDGQFCKLTDRKAVGKGKLPSFVFGKVSWVGDHFVIANVGRNYESDDGLTWTNNLFKPVGTKINGIARGDSGTYVGVDGTNTGFYRSTDGVTWEKVTGPSGPNLVDVVFGWAKPSAACPK